ncbi:hypothetical protein ACPA54_08765 [Uniformispora flossi]|uniref:hypothetical protein n=1 Tax=Uniformispora flossi TaxID=3390723 RepID=UPI003C2D0C66
MTLLIVFAAVLGAAVAATAYVIARRTSPTENPEGLAIERARTSSAQRSGGVFGVHGLGAQTTYTLGTEENHKTFG